MRYLSSLRSWSIWNLGYRTHLFLVGWCPGKAEKIDRFGQVVRIAGIQLQELAERHVRLIDRCGCVG